MKSRLLLTSLAASALLTSPVFAATPPSSTTSPAAAASTAAPAATAQNANAMSRATNRSAGNTALYRSAQAKLRDLHLYNGEINGTRNAAYIGALRRFQREHHLNVTGRLDARTRQALGIT